MPFTSTGAAFFSGLEDMLMQRAERERQARLDAQATETHQANMLRAQKLLEREDADRALKMEDRERSKTEKEIEGMIIGDIPTEDLTVRARKHGIPMRTAVQPPSPAEVEAPGIITEMSEDGASGETPVAPMPAGAIRFAGDPVQVRQQQQDAFLRQKEANDVAAEQARQAAIDAKALATENATTPVMRVNPRTGKLEQIGEAPKGAHYVTEPAPPGQGSSAGADSRINSRVARFDNSAAAKNFEMISGNWEQVKDVDLKATGAAGASQDAMLIYKFAKTMDPASAVREGEYNTVSEWATAVLPKYGFKLERMLSPAQLLTEDGRKALRDEIGKAYKAQRSRYNKGVEQLGTDLKRIGGANTQNWRDKIEEDDEEKPAGPAGVPSVGSSFNGGKVLKVTPVN